MVVKRTHLAGIIPLSGIENDFCLSTPPELTPINAGFTAIQKSVYECALAGCNTIWIVANEDTAPVVRKIVGEWFYDPVYYKRMKFGENSDNRREIPIYYAPIHPKDIGRRDSYGWSVLNGVYSSWRIANKISKWIVPQKYFISFPLSTYDIQIIRKNRKLISHTSKNFSLCYQQQTVKDGVPLPFTMFGEDYIKCRRDVNKKTTREYYPPQEGEKYPSQKRPIHERWSAKNFLLSDVFDKLEINDTIEVPWHYDISSWQKYRDYLSSDFLIKTPNEVLTKARKHVKIPYTNHQEGTYESD